MQRVAIPETPDSLLRANEIKSLCGRDADMIQIIADGGSLRDAASWGGLTHKGLSKRLVKLQAKLRKAGY